MTPETKPPYINRPPRINKPQPTNLDLLEAEFYKHSNGMKNMDTSDRMLAFLACDAVLLDVISCPEWERTDVPDVTV